jgi:hypothetical protein
MRKSAYILEENVAPSVFRVEKAINQHEAGRKQAGLIF